MIYPCVRFPLYVCVKMDMTVTPCCKSEWVKHPTLNEIAVWECAKCHCGFELVAGYYDPQNLYLQRVSSVLSTYPPSQSILNPNPAIGYRTPARIEAPMMAVKPSGGYSPQAIGLAVVVSAILMLFIRLV